MRRRAKRVLSTKTPIMLLILLSLFKQGEAATVLAAMLLIVGMVDLLSAVLRRGLSRGGV